MCLNIRSSEEDCMRIIRAYILNVYKYMYMCIYRDGKRVDLVRESKCISRMNRRVGSHKLMWLLRITTTRTLL